MEQENQKHLFLFTISPVQSFIGQARKRQTLMTKFIKQIDDGNTSVKLTF